MATLELASVTSRGFLSIIQFSIIVKTTYPIHESYEKEYTIRTRNSSLPITSDISMARVIGN